MTKKSSIFFLLHLLNFIFIIRLYASETMSLQKVSSLSLIRKNFFERRDVSINSLTIALKAIQENVSTSTLTALLEQDTSFIHMPCVNQNNDTLLSIAIQGHNIDAVRILLHYGACINQPSGDERLLPLHYAAQIKNEELCTLFLEHPDIEINKRSFDGKTALHYAVLSDWPWFVQKLLEKGAHINICDNNWATPLDLAIAIESVSMGQKKMNQAVVDILKTYDAQISGAFSPRKKTLCQKKK